MHKTLAALALTATLTGGATGHGVIVATGADPPRWGVTGPGRSSARL